VLVARFFLYFVNGDRLFFHKNAHVVGKIEINTVIVITIQKVCGTVFRLCTSTTWVSW